MLPNHKPKTAEDVARTVALLRVVPHHHRLAKTDERGHWAQIVTDSNGVLLVRSGFAQRTLVYSVGAGERGTSLERHNDTPRLAC